MTTWPAEPPTRPTPSASTCAASAEPSKNRTSGSSIWLRQRKPGETGLYLGIACDTSQAVDASYAAAISAGATDEGAPADRTYLAPGYYAANVGDFDGNILEFVHKAWSPAR
jgi:hypothetical protein